VTDIILRTAVRDSTISKPILTHHEVKEEILPVQTRDKIAVEKYRISDDSKRMLIDVMQHPTSGIASRYKRLVLGVARGAALVTSLLSTSLLTSDIVSTPEGRVRFLQLTDKGLEALKQGGISVTQRKRAGGPEHEYLKHRVAEMLQDKGYEVTMEKPIGGGGTVDIEAQKDGEIIAVEIETGKSDAEANVRKSIAAGYKEIWSVWVRDVVKGHIIDVPDQVYLETLPVTRLEEQIKQRTRRLDKNLTL
jgi:hypothetical protein